MWWCSSTRDGWPRHQERVPPDGECDRVSIAKATMARIRRRGIKRWAGQRALAEWAAPPTFACRISRETLTCFRDRGQRVEFALLVVDASEPEVHSRSSAIYVV